MDPVGLAAVATVLVAGVAFGWWRSRHDGRLADSAARSQDQGMTDGVRLEPALLQRLGVEPATVTLLQFSTAFCAPCRAVRRISAEVATLLPAVRHVEVDAESHLDEVRELDIWRTPTLLIIDAEGREVRRATGVPTKPHLIAALADLVPSPGGGR
jgi:thiol-disulfide isomerase/thioredoxin